MSTQTVSRACSKAALHAAWRSACALSHPTCGRRESAAPRAARNAAASPRRPSCLPVLARVMGMPTRHPCWHAPPRQARSIMERTTARWSSDSCPIIYARAAAWALAEAPGRMASAHCEQVRQALGPLLRQRVCGLVSATWLDGPAKRTFDGRRRRRARQRVRRGAALTGCGLLAALKAGARAVSRAPQPVSWAAVTRTSLTRTLATSWRIARTALRCRSVI